MSNTSFQNAVGKVKSRILKAKPWVKSHTRELTIAATVAGAFVLIGGAALISHHHPSRHGASHPASAPAKSYTPASTIHHDTPHATLVSAPVPNRASQEYMKNGFDYYSHKDYGEAVNAFKEAADQDENNADARWWLGKSYQNLGKDSKACKQFDAYLEIAPRGSHASDAKAAVKKCG